MPGFVVTVDGERLLWGRTEVEEMFALLVDRGSEGVTTGEVIACLWPGRTADDSTQSLSRVTFKRMMDTLKEKGVDDIIATDGRKKYLLTQKVECDLYRILDGDQEKIRLYSGEYMRQYSWAETRNAQLSSIKMANIAVCDSGTGLWLCKAGESNCGSCLSWGRELRCGRGR